jgi:hypothetical protein
LRPFKRISDALAALENEIEPNLIVGNGEYRENLIITHKVQLLGNCPDAENGTRIVSPLSDEPVLTLTTQAAGSRISDLYLEGGSAGIMVEAAEVSLGSLRIHATRGPRLRTALKSPCDQRGAESDARNIYGPPVLVLFAVALIPVSEECLFRGVLLDGFRRYVPFHWANGFQAMLFALAHFDSRTPTLVGMAIFAGLLRHRRRSLVTSATLHAVNNTLALPDPTMKLREGWLA